MDVLTGRLFAIRKQNEREAYEAFQRDKVQREALAREQLRKGVNFRIGWISLRGNSASGAVNACATCLASRVRGHGPDLSISICEKRHA
jgi:hypothetical protein